MPEISPADTQAALCVALSLPDEATVADLDAAVARLDGPGALAALRALADLLGLADEGAES